MTDARPYQVLARKYRPETFADLVGQEPMVRTLRNAFASGRIAQAFVMTGIRGTGKTTTARIIAKGLNCIGADGTGGPTTAPCGQCDPCRAIAEGRHVDVIEMDAASHTGVQNIRDAIIETVSYRAASARYKVFIIDEVHMLSTSAFNALLKTLEEPPPHVKFIFATTEIRKVPVTVLSRCQRFDLRRIEPDVMLTLLRRIATAEGAQIGDDALGLIVRAAEGSARDATSLLDQAISHGAGDTTAAQVRAMLGLADRGRVLDLFDLILRGQAADALSELGTQYADGADPLAILRDLAEACHWLSVVKITPDAGDDPTLTADERDRGQTMAAGAPMRVLTRFWQMILKALEEVSQAPNAMMAAEMAVIRLTHVADMPTPEEALRKLGDAPKTALPSPPRAPVAPTPGGPRASTVSGGALPAPAAQPLDRFARFDDVVALIRANRDMGLLIAVENNLRLARYQPGRIEITPTDDAAPDLAQRLGARLQVWTGARWVVIVTADGADQPTIAETRAGAERQQQAAVETDPLVLSILTAFPRAKITAIRPPAPPPQATPDDAPDDWDPFEEG